jgi:hypothetical protein
MRRTSHHRGTLFGLSSSFPFPGSAAMIRRRRRRRGDLERERMLLDLLEISLADISCITLRVVGSTAMLGGYITTSWERKEIIGRVLGHAGVGQVIDSMALPGECATVTVHCGKERQDVQRALNEFCCRKPVRGMAPALAGHGDSRRAEGTPARFAVNAALVYARRSAQRLLSSLRGRV